MTSSSTPWVYVITFDDGDPMVRGPFDSDGEAKRALDATMKRLRGDADGGDSVTGGEVYRLRR